LLLTQYKIIAQGADKRNQIPFP